MSVEDRVWPLDRAKEIVSKDRNSSYGTPEDNFAAIGELIDVYRKYNRGQNGRSHDVAIEMVLMKIGRIASGAPRVDDNYVDVIGYAACAFEMAVTNMSESDMPVVVVERLDRR